MKANVSERQFALSCEYMKMLVMLNAQKIINKEEVRKAIKEDPVFKDALKE